MCLIIENIFFFSQNVGSGSKRHQRWKLSQESVDYSLNLKYKKQYSSLTALLSLSYVHIGVDYKSNTFIIKMGN